MAGKADIVDFVAQSVEGLTKKEAAEATEAVFDRIADLLVDGERVQLSGFGSFSVSTRAARTGRNPATGEPIEIPETRNAKFKAAKALKESLNA